MTVRGEIYYKVEKSNKVKNNYFSKQSINNFFFSVAVLLYHAFVTSLCSLLKEVQQHLFLIVLLEPPVGSEWFLFV